MFGQLFIEVRQSLLHLFYPSLCEGCQSPLIGSEWVLCLACESQLPETGYHHIAENDTVMRFAGRVPLTSGTSLAWFTADGLMQHLIHGLKYNKKKETGLYLGNLLGQRIAEAGWPEPPEIIIPVPLHPAKEAKRGYNQSDLIARGIAEAIGAKVGKDILVRARKTESQTNKSRTERVKNMENAFQLKNPSAIAGKHLLLVDDVLTTGATLEACATALMKVESIKISIATIGIAVS